MKPMYFATGIVLALACLAGTSFAADDVKKDAPPAPAAAEETDPYKVPTGADADKLVAFCKSVYELRRGIRTKEEFEVHLEKMRPAVQKACELILNAEKKESTENARFARRNLFFLSLKPLAEAPDVDTAKFAKKVVEFVASKDVVMSKDDAGLAYLAGRFLEGKNQTQAKDFYAELVPVLQKSMVPEIAKLATDLGATVKRFNLLGNPVEVKGTTLDGKPFDVASLKGKVVLIDFWATWCKYCIEEFPNVRKNYAAYHNKGFEVVGISVDEQRPVLDEFMKTEKLPWIVLNDEGGKNDAITRCGVTAYPTTIMVGKDGKVVSVIVRGEMLGKLLKEQLGEPEPVPVDNAPKADETKK